ncbi:MAG TPA: hypothetical protein EYG71_06255, partial [Leucothrix sp.]|nr:hypothetical protein [Leucothrix sp.]
MPAFFNTKSVLSFLVLIALVTTTNLAAKQPTKELVFILAGQSNMAGQGNTVELSPSYQRVPRNVEFYYNGYKTPL